MKLRVLFNGVEHRERRRETIRHPPQGVHFLTIQALDSMRKDHILSFNPKEKGVAKSLKHISRVWTSNNWIAKRYLKNIDLVYSCGHLVLNKVPFVVEIDNVAVLAYYKLGLLAAMKPFIRKVLRSERCKAIVCISGAAKKSVQNYFNDPAITNKCVVVYPYIGAPLARKKQPKTTTFLFVATNFYLKGGKEVAHAFEQLSLKRKGVKLIIVTRKNLIDQALRERIEANPAVTLVEADKSKEELFKKYYSKADVFVLPTYQDSFGMVFLEALKAGLPIITTRMFATPEMVEQGKNGYLIESPVPYFKKNFLPNPKWWEKDKAEYAKTHNFSVVERRLHEAMEKLAGNASLRKRMGKHSFALINNKFSEKNRLGKLRSTLFKAAQGHA